MCDQNSISSAIRVNFIQIFLLFILQTEVYSSCPAPCLCVFDDKEDSRSTCDFGNSIVNTTVHRLLGRPVLSVTCQGTNYTCDGFPKFDIQGSEIWVVMSSCAPSILICLSEVYTPMTIDKVEIHDLIDQGTTREWSVLQSTWDVRFYLKDNDSLPTVGINSLPVLKQLYIEGGSFKLSSNLHNITNTMLNNLELNKNGINDISGDTFNGVSYLTSLRISGNHFKNINMEAFQYLNALQELELRNNEILSVEVSKSDLDASRQLRLLKMYNNSLKFLPNRFFSGYYLLERILIKDNQIDLKLDTNAFSRLSPSVKLLQLTNCMVRELPPNVFEGSSNVHNFNLNDNLIETLHPDLFSTAYSVRGLSLSRNQIKSIPDSIFSSMKKLELLDLSHNNIERLSSLTFEMNTKLRVLYLDNNAIMELDKDIFKGKVFQSVSMASNKLRNVDGLAIDQHSSWETKELNLSHNEIEVFPEWLVKLPKLEYLDLSFNKIKMLSNNHMYTQNLKLIINLRDNAISNIIADVTNGREARKLDENFHIYLLNNKLECDCLSTTILHEWNRRKILGDFNDLICVNEAKISTIDVYLHCNKKHAMIALIGSSVVGTLFGLIILISIVTRWNEIWEYISRNILNRSTNDSTILELRQDAAKPYDLFISFAHQDEEFVTENLLPKLEFEYGQKVCVHYRDWVVGDLIPDQIIKSVENARMTIIILTENFLMSDWSYLEFRTAHNLGLQEGKPRVILILLNESITKDERLSIDIKSYIAINSYLVWRDPYFWTKLEKRLSRGGHKLNLYEK